MSVCEIVFFFLAREESQGWIDPWREDRVHSFQHRLRLFGHGHVWCVGQQAHKIGILAKLSRLDIPATGGAGETTYRNFEQVLLPPSRADRTCRAGHTMEPTGEEVGSKDQPKSGGNQPQDLLGWQDPTSTSTSLDTPKTSHQKPPPTPQTHTSKGSRLVWSNCKLTGSLRRTHTCEKLCWSFAYTRSPPDHPPAEVNTWGMPQAWKPFEFSLTRCEFFVSRRGRESAQKLPEPTRLQLTGAKLTFRALMRNKPFQLLPENKMFWNDPLIHTLTLFSPSHTQKQLESQGGVCTATEATPCQTDNSPPSPPPEDAPGWPRCHTVPCQQQ